MSDYRREQDSLGEVNVPAAALYGAQTQRAVDNFQLSGNNMPAPFICALGLIKAAAAQANSELGSLESDLSGAVVEAAMDIANGQYHEQFPVDVFQTGSGTSTNMNANEVIATLASRRLGRTVHANDHVNCGQSSNDVIPTAIHVSAELAVANELMPALLCLQDAISQREHTLADCVKTGRTHLMDAMPVSLAQELSGWRAQVVQAGQRIESCRTQLQQVAQGGTAVGTGVNTDPQFATRFCFHLSRNSGAIFRPSDNFFAAINHRKN